MPRVSEAATPWAGRGNNDNYDIFLKSVVAREAGDASTLLAG